MHIEGQRVSVCVRAHLHTNSSGSIMNSKNVCMTGVFVPICIHGSVCTCEGSCMSVLCMCVCVYACVWVCHTRVDGGLGAAVDSGPR